MNNWKRSLIIAAMLVLVWLAPATYAQSQPNPANSAKSSPTPDTPASSRQSAESRRQDVTNACAAAVDDLNATRQLAETLDAENRALETRLETEEKTTALLRELNEIRLKETAELRAALAAKNETIAAKDAVIAAQDKLAGQLKRKKSSPWQRLGDVLLGAAIAVIFK